MSNGFHQTFKLVYGFFGVTILFIPYDVLMLSNFSLIRHPSPTVLIPALRTVGNIVTGDDMQTQVFNMKNIIFH